MSGVPGVFLLATVVLAIVLAVVLRLFRAPGWSVLGGIIAGVIMGPTLTGRLAPDFYERHIIGGRAEREALAAAQSEHGANQVARDAAGLDQSQQQTDVLDELQRERRLRRAWEDARRRHAMPWAVSVAIAAAVFFLLSGAARQTLAGEPPDWYAALSIGLWAAAFPGAISLALLVWIDYELPAAIAAAAAAGVGSVLLRRDDLQTADDAEIGGARLIGASARVASIAAIGALLWVAWRSDDRVALGIVLALVAIPAGWFLPRLDVTMLHRIIDLILVPALAALAAMRIELFEHFSIWAIIIFAILSGDGRWLGAYLGAKLSAARRSLPTMRLVLAAMSAGTGQVALTAVGLAAGVLSEPLAYALLIGALVMELTTNTRRRIAREIEQTEQELEKLEEEG